MDIKRLAHAAIFIQSGALNIYFDPYMLPEKSIKADFIFVSHEHYDHFSPTDINKIAKPDTVLIGPEPVIGQAAKEGLPIKNTISVAQQGQYTAGGITFETFPAYNIGKPFHPIEKGGVGYLVNLENEVICFAGDTDATEHLKNIRCTIALLPIGGKYTMNAAEAAEAANAIKPRVAIPMHYASIASVAGPEAAVVFSNSLSPAIECRII